MKNWPWQKWVGKAAPFIVGLGGLIWTFVEKEPQWWPIVVGAVTGVTQWLISVFPSKA